MDATIRTGEPVDWHYSKNPKERDLGRIADALEKIAAVNDNSPRFECVDDHAPGRVRCLKTGFEIQCYAASSVARFLNTHCRGTDG